MKTCRVSYNNFDDSLLMSCKQENENIKKTFAIDNFIFYLTRKGKIVGLQLRNASEILSESDINPNLLENIESAELIISPKENSLFIGIKIISENKSTNLPLRVFMPSEPQMNILA